MIARLFRRRPAEPALLDELVSALTRLRSAVADYQQLVRTRAGGHIEDLRLNDAEDAAFRALSRAATAKAEGRA